MRLYPHPLAPRIAIDHSNSAIVGYYYKWFVLNNDPLGLF